MPIYMKWTGINGTVTAAGYEKQIPVHSFQFGIGRGIGSPMGHSHDRESSAPSVSEVVITKDTDASSTHLFEEALHGEGKKVEFNFVKTDKDKLETYLHYELDEVLISGFSMSSGGDNPHESISLNFTKIIMKNTPTGSKNQTGTVMPTGWNLATQKKV